MIIDQHYKELKEKLSSHPKHLENPEDWLFVLENTMKAMIENIDKGQLDQLDTILTKKRSQDLKLTFDFCQGRFGREGFSYRKHPSYLYLSSLVAIFPEFELSQADQEYLKEIAAYNHHLLYDMC